MIALMRWLAGRRLGTLHAWGWLLGWLGFLLSGTYRRRLVAHATQAGVEPAERRAAVAAAGQMVAELPWLWLRPPLRGLGDVVRWEGADAVEAAIARGRGIVILTPHLGCFEVAAQALAERFGDRAPITVMYRPARQAWLRELQRTARDRPGLAAVPATLAGIRQMVRALRRAEAVGLLPDQVPPDGLGVWAPFFGRAAYTMTLAARLVQQTDAALLVCRVRRLPHGAGYEMTIGPGPELPPPSGDADAHAQACAGVINAAMEALIRRCPGQYLWGYNRYKPPRRLQAAEAVGGPS